jgi:hypothetical protein
MTGTGARKPSRLGSGGRSRRQRDKPDDRTTYIHCSARDPRPWSPRKESLAMSPKKISGGVVHELPADLKKALASVVIVQWTNAILLLRILYGQPGKL